LFFFFRVTNDMVNWEVYAGFLGGTAVAGTAFIMLCTLLWGLMFLGILTFTQAMILTVLIGFAGYGSYLYVQQMYNSMGGSSGLSAAAMDLANDQGCPEVKNIYSGMCGSSSTITQMIAPDVANLVCNELKCGNCNYGTCPSSST
jgi:hypothetical protein